MIWYGVPTATHDSLIDLKLGTGRFNVARNPNTIQRHVDPEFPYNVSPSSDKFPR